MAPIVIPSEQRQFLTVSNSGFLALTIAQRTARSLSVSIEKIKINPPPEYFNFRTPEPQSFWGYLQTLQRDFVVGTHQLQYRREVVLSNDNFALEPIEQLRCLIKDSTLLLFDSIIAILAKNIDIDEEKVGQDRANYILKNAQPRLIPALPITGIYYELVPGYAAQISIIWTPYASPCENPAGNQTLPSPRSPGKDESGPGGNDGGGTRPPQAVPPGQASDPDSDNAGPPPDSPDGPPSPSIDDPDEPLQNGPYRVTIEIQAFLSGSGPCVEQPGPRPTIPYDVANGPATIAKESNGEAGFIWRLRDANGALVGGISGASYFSDCDTVVRIISQVPIS